MRIKFYITSSFLFIILIWQLVFFISPDVEKVIPAPIEVLTALISMTENGILLRYTVASIFRVTAGFYIALVLALPLGLLLGQCSAANKIFNALIQFLRPISPLAWIPLAMIWFGIGDPPAIFLIFISCFFPLLISIISAVQNINKRYFQIGENLAFNSIEKVKYIMLPAILPDIITAVRVSVGVGWMVVVAAEMIAVKSGLGYLIIDSRNALRMDRVVASMIMIGIIGMILDKIILRITKLKSLEWRFGSL
jgi:NitT/TauT family transport system permease protein